VFSCAVLSKRCEIDHAENKKEQVRILSSFLANPSFLALATGANALKQETTRPTAKKNRVHQVANWPFTAVVDRIFTIFLTPTSAYRTKSLMAAPFRNPIVCHINTMLPCCILSANKIVKLTDPVIARRVPEVPVPFFLQRDPVICDALTVFDKQPDASDEEVVPKVPGALQKVSIKDANELVVEPALLLQRPVPMCIAERQTSTKFDGTD
jgi:hypothetical protein